MIGVVESWPFVLCAPVYFAHWPWPVLFRFSETVHSAEPPPVPPTFGATALALEISVPATTTGPSR